MELLRDGAIRLALTFPLSFSGACLPRLAPPPQTAAVFLLHRLLQKLAHQHRWDREKGENPPLVSVVEGSTGLGLLQL